MRSRRRRRTYSNLLLSHKRHNRHNYNARTKLWSRRHDVVVVAVDDDDYYHYYYCKRGSCGRPHRSNNYSRALSRSLVSTGEPQVLWRVSLAAADEPAGRLQASHRPALAPPFMRSRSAQLSTGDTPLPRARVSRCHCQADVYVRHSQVLSSQVYRL